MLTFVKHEKGAEEEWARTLQCNGPRLHLDLPSLSIEFNKCSFRLVKAMYAWINSTQHNGCKFLNVVMLNLKYVWLNSTVAEFVCIKCHCDLLICFVLPWYETWYWSHSGVLALLNTASSHIQMHRDHMTRCPLSKLNSWSKVNWKGKEVKVLSFRALLTAADTLVYNTHSGAFNLVCVRSCFHGEGKPTSWALAPVTPLCNNYSRFPGLARLQDACVA